MVDLHRHGFSGCQLVSWRGLGLVCVCHTKVPWPWAPSVPGIVEFEYVSVVRIDSPGFVEEIRVKDGQRIFRGDVLLVLNNEELLAECRDLEIGIEKSLARQGVLLRQEKIAEVHIEREEKTKLRRRLIEKTLQRELLTVRAPQDGVVMSVGLPEREGVWLEYGTELLSIGNAAKREIQIAVDQQNVESFTASENPNVMVRTADGRYMSGWLEQIEPRSDQRPLDEALSAENGGSLAMRPSTTTDATMELVEPHFRGTVRLDKHEDLAPGQRTTVSLGSSTQSFGEGLHTTIAENIKSRIRANTLQEETAVGLVAIVLGFERTVDRDVQVVGLLLV